MYSTDTFAIPSQGSRVKVAIRCRPIQKSQVEDQGVNHAEVVQTVDDNGIGRVFLAHSSGKSREFVYDHAFGPECDQVDIFEAIAQPVVDDFLGGRNGTLFAYGQTGTGKTYTMGVLEFVNNENAGIIPRAISRIFDYADEEAAAENASVKVTLSFLQLYRDAVQDLLAPSAIMDKNNQRDPMNVVNLSIREDPLKGFYVEGLQEFEVNSYSEAEVLINVGLENRAIASTMMNTTSSRSHTVLTLHVKIQQRKKMKRSGALELYERAVCSKLMLVDLAGSERVRRSESQGTRLAEAKSINSSLSALGNVIAALAGQNPEEQPQKQGHTHIPYRDTKLTKLLQDSLGGTASTAIIATVGPAAADYEETLSTLQFASRCMSVRVMTIPHSVSVDFEVLCADLREEVCSLEDALVRQEQVAASQRAVYNVTIKQLYAELLESRRLSAVKGSDREKVSSPQPFDFKKLEVFINQLSEAAKSSSTSSSVQWGKEKEKRGTVNPLAPNSIDSSAYKDKMTDHVNIEYDSKSPSAQYENGLRFDDIYPAHHSGKDTNVSVSTESFIRVIGDPEVNERVAIRQMEKNGMHLEDPLRKKLIKASSLSVQSNTGMQSGKIQRTQTGSESDTDTESRTQLLVQPEKISDHSGNQKHSWSQPITSGHVLLVDNNSSSSTSYKSHRVPVTSPPTVSPHSTSSSSSKHEGDDSRCGNSDGANSEYPPNRAMEVIREKDRHPWEERADVTTRDARSVVDRIAALSSAQIARMNPAAREQVLAIRRQLLDADRDQRERSAENNYDNQRRGTSTYAANDVHSPTNGSRVQRPPHTQHRYRDCTLDED